MSKWCLEDFPINFTHIFRFSQACYMPCSSQLPSLGLRSNVCWQLQMSPFSSVSLCSFLGATNHVCLTDRLCIMLRHAVRSLQQGVLYLQTVTQQHNTLQTVTQQHNTLQTVTQQHNTLQTVTQQRPTFRPIFMQPTNARHSGTCTSLVPN
jgi:hypothetical protein